MTGPDAWHGRRALPASPRQASLVSRAGRQPRRGAAAMPHPRPDLSRSPGPAADGNRPSRFFQPRPPPAMGRVRSVDYPHQRANGRRLPASRAHEDRGTWNRDGAGRPAGQTAGTRAPARARRTGSWGSSPGNESPHPPAPHRRPGRPRPAAFPGLGGPRRAAPHRGGDPGSAPVTGDWDRRRHAQPRAAPGRRSRGGVGPALALLSCARFCAGRSLRPLAFGCGRSTGRMRPMAGGCRT